MKSTTFIIMGIRTLGRGEGFGASKIAKNEYFKAKNNMCQEFQILFENFYQYEG